MISTEQALPCPVCQTKIPFDPYQLIKGFKFSCPSCTAAIGVSSDSLGEVKDSMEKFDKIKAGSVKL